MMLNDSTSTREGNLMLSEEKHIVALDLGTTKVCTLVGIVSHDQKLQLLGVGQYPSSGLKKGLIVDIDKASLAVKNSVHEVSVILKKEITDVSVGISGAHIHSFNHQVSLKISTGVVRQKDIDSKN